jgi:hypothetical protein
MKSCVLAYGLGVLILSQLASAAEEPPKSTQASQGIISGPPLADLPNFPIGYDVIQGNPPDSHIKRWIRYVIVGQQNHPFPIVFFSPQKFKPKTALEQLIVLPDSEYKSLSAFSRTQPCTKQERRPMNDPGSGGDITEHNGTETTRCALLLVDACNYLSGIIELPNIRWTPAQLKLIQRVAMETNCTSNNSNSSR